jgi:hypothetical protein
LSDKADGTYPGTIVHAYVAEDQWDPGQYVLKLDVNLEGGGAVTCRQQLKDSEKEKRDQVMRALGLTYPFKSADLIAIERNGIDVNLHTSKKGAGRQNAYVATMREERVLTAEEIDALADAKEDVPF